MTIPLVINDGGAPFEDLGHCATRSAAIVTGLPFAQVYAELGKVVKTMNARSRVWHYQMIAGRRVGISNSPRRGVQREALAAYLASLGWRWVAWRGRLDHLPTGRLLVNLKGHVTALIDGVEHSTYSAAELGSVSVYGYWVKS